MVAAFITKGTGMKKIILSLIVSIPTLAISQTEEDISKLTGKPICSGWFDSSYNDCIGTKKYPKSKVVGVFRHGEIHGYGETKFVNDGSYYKGNILLGDPHGEGELLYKSGGIFKGRHYYGQLSNGEYTGSKNEKRFRFIGDFKDGWFHKGTFFLININDNTEVRIEGEFDPKTGSAINGKIFFSNGDVYSGDILNNDPHGNGELVTAEGSIKYSGIFKEGKYIGKSARSADSLQELPNFFTFSQVSDSLKPSLCKSLTSITNWASNSLSVSLYLDHEQIYSQLYKTGNYQLNGTFLRNGSCTLALNISGTYNGNSYRKNFSCSIKSVTRDQKNKSEFNIFDFASCN